ncbi:hypothetical protein KAH37_03330 [bacterium]|nr:hypothetical protein [bacterium]
MVNFKQSLLISLVLFLLISWWHIYFPTIPNPNERVRFFLTHSLATRGDFAIDKEIRHYGGTIDRSRVDGKTYCDKAPMLSFLGVPTMVILTQISGEWPSEKKALRWLKFTTIYPFAILLFWLIFAILLTQTKQKSLAFIGAGATLFATPIFTWFQVYFSHSVVATMLLLFYFLSTKIRREKEPSIKLLILTGLVGGITFWSEYTVAPMLGIISALTLFMMKNRKQYLWFLVGGFSIGILFTLHNLLLFGGPFSLGYSHLAEKGFAAGQSKGLFGITTPTLNAVIQTLFSFRIGIVTLSPFVLFSLAPFFNKKMRKNSDILEWWALFLAHFLLVTSFAFWGGGGSFGSRHMVSALPFLVMLSVVGLSATMQIKQSFLTIYLAFATFSTFIFMTVSVIFPFFVSRFTNPMATFLLPAVREKFFPHNSLISPFISNSTAQYIIWVLLLISLTIFILSTLLKRSLFKVTIVTLFALSLYLLSFVPSATKPDALWDAYMTMGRVEQNSERRKKEIILKKEMRRKRSLNQR